MKKPWWHGMDIPLCRNCSRPISEHWEFPAVCDRYAGPMKEGGDARENDDDHRP